jgi:S1-C subfamily serine protease
LLIMQVIPGGAADEAGLRGGSQRAYLGNTPIMVGGDLIVAINGERIEEAQDLAHLMNNLKAGDTVTVTIWRGKQKMDVKVKLQEVRADRRA